MPRLTGLSVKPERRSSIAGVAPAVEDNGAVATLATEQPYAVRRVERSCRPHCMTVCSAIHLSAAVGQSTKRFWDDLIASLDIMHAGVKAAG